MCRAPGKATTLTIDIREPVRRHAFYCMVRDLSTHVDFCVSQFGNVTITDDWDPFVWEVNGLRFVGCSRVGRERHWTWGILQMAVNGIHDCLYGGKWFNAIRFLVDVDSVGVVGGGEIFNLSGQP